MFIETIVGHVRDELIQRERKTPPSMLRDRPLFNLPPRDFEGHLKGSSRHIIAEVKRASPSKGLIRQEFDAVDLARALAENGASALSILTEERFFQGSLFYLEQVKAVVSLPLLRKDFIVDGYQLLEARGFGADAVLFIATLLEESVLRELIDQARSLSLQVLVEVHSEDELERALAAGATFIGINSRDLRTFKVSLETIERLVPMVPRGMTVVCESGIESREQMERLEDLGAHVFLVGETLMRARDPGAKLKELLNSQ